MRLGDVLKGLEKRLLDVLIACVMRFQMRLVVVVEEEEGEEDEGIEASFPILISSIFKLK